MLFLKKQQRKKKRKKTMKNFPKTSVRKHKARFPSLLFPSKAYYHRSKVETC